MEALANPVLMLSVTETDSIVGRMRGGANRPN